MLSAGRASFHCFFAIILVSPAIARAEEPLTNILPAGALASLEIENLGPAIQRLQTSELLTAVVESPGYQQWTTSGDGRKLRGARAILEGQIGTNLWQAARDSLGHQIVVAAYPSRQVDEGPFATVLLIQFAQPQWGRTLREKLEPWIELSEGKLVATEDHQKRWMVHSADQRAWGVLTDSWLLLATREDLQNDVLARLSEPKTGSLLQTTAWSHATKSLPKDESARLRLVVDHDALKALQGDKSASDSKMDNPMASLLFGGLVGLARVAPSSLTGLTVTPDEFQLEVRLNAGQDELSAAGQSLLAPSTSLSLSPVPRQLSSLTLSRDWLSWYRGREELIDAKALPEFDKFETGLATFLPGKDFAEDVLSLLGRSLTFVTALQTYPHLDGHPGLQIPAIGMVVELSDPQRGADVLQLFFQTLGTIANIEAGRQGRQPWVMSSEAFQGTQITFARYLDRPAGEDLGMIYNYQPASALVGRYYVAATSLELTRDLIASCQQREATPTGDRSPARHDEIAVDPVVAADALQANRDVIVAKGVQSGKPAESADQELARATALLKQMSPLRLVIEPEAHRVTVRFSTGWNTGSHARDN